MGAVAQDSVLGRRLRLIIINDFVATLQTRRFFFVNGMKLVGPVENMLHALKSSKY